MSTANGVSTLTSASVNLINTWDQAVTGTGIAAGTTVASVTDFHTVVLSQPATGPVSNVVIGATATQSTQQITQNNQVATQLGLTRYNKANLVQPDISGLGNPAFLQAAHGAGIKYLIYDTSRTPSNGVNEGIYNSIDPSILEIARYPVNLYFNVQHPGAVAGRGQLPVPGRGFRPRVHLRATARPGKHRLAALPAAGPQPAADVPRAEPAGVPGRQRQQPAR